jgi:hypothetical protein
MPTAVYATHADFEDGVPADAIRERLARGLAEAESVVAAGAAR